MLVVCLGCPELLMGNFCLYKVRQVMNRKYFQGEKRGEKETVLWCSGLAYSSSYSN